MTGIETLSIHSREQVSASTPALTMKVEGAGQRRAESMMVTEAEMASANFHLAEGRASPLITHKGVRTAGAKVSTWRNLTCHLTSTI